MDKPGNGAEGKEDTNTMTKAEKAITELNDAITSSQEESMLIIANLKKLVHGDKKRKALLSSNFYRSKLRDDGLTDSEIRSLSRVLSVQGGNVVFKSNFHLILIAFNVIESGERGIQNFMKLFDCSYADNFRQIGIMVCEILFYPKVHELAKIFFNLKSSVEIQMQVLKILKNELLNARHARLLNVIHMIASCGNRMKDAVPDEVEELSFYDTNLQVSNIVALTTVISHCTEVRRLSFDSCDFTSSCVKTFQTRLWKSKVKILEINFSANKDMGVEGLAHIGGIAKEHEVDKLDLSDCGLSAEEVKSFNEGAGDANIYEIDFSSNKGMGVNGLAHIRAIVKQHEVNKLNLSNCGLNAEEVESFNKGADDAKGGEVIRKIKRQYKVNKLSIRWREFTDDIMKTLKKEVEESLGNVVEHDVRSEQDAATVQARHESDTEDDILKILQRLYESPPHSYPTVTLDDSKTDGDISKIPLSPNKPSLTTQVKAMHLEQSILSKITTREVGPKGETITVGGCSVAFSEGCFYDTGTVTIVASLDSLEIHPSKEIVTPILSVSAKNMRKPATVTLSTWCVDEENQGIGVNVIRYSSSKGEWMDLCQCILGKSGFIRFECDHFSKVLGVKEKDAPLTYSLKPVICTVDRVLNIALMKDVNLQMNLFLKAVEQGDRYSKFSNLHHNFNNVTCTRSDTFVIEIEDDENTITFEPKELPFDINDVVEGNGLSYKSCLMKGTVARSPVDVMFLIKKKGVRKQSRIISLDMTQDFKSAANLLKDTNLKEAQQQTAKCEGAFTSIPISRSDKDAETPH